MLMIAPALKRAVFEKRLQGVRQCDLAYQVGLHPSLLSHLLAGSIPIRHNDARVLRVAQALGIPADEAFINSTEAA